MASNFYVSSVGYTAVAQWAASTAFALNSYVRQLATPTVNNERVFKATSISGTGTSGGSEPSWNLGSGATTTDNAGANQIVWTEVTGTQANQSAGNWTAPGARIAAFPSGKIASGDFIFVSQDHAETQTTALTIQYGGSPGTSNKIICVNRAGGSSLPPVTADLATTATVSTTGASTITLRGFIYFYGVQFQAGSSSNAANINFSAGSTFNSEVFTFDNCILKLNNTSGSSSISCGAAAWSEWINTSVNFGAAGQTIKLGFSNITWRDTPSAATAGTVPTVLFTLTNGQGGGILCQGVDLSAINTTLCGAFTNTGQTINVTLANCLLNSSVTEMVNGGSSGPFWDPSILTLDGCDSTTGNSPSKFSRHYYGGIVSRSLTIVRTGGATWGTVPISMLMTPYSGVTVVNNQPSVFPAIKYPYTSTLNVSKTFTLECLTFQGATIPTNAMLWVEMEIMDSSASPLSSLHSSRVANLLPSTSATNLTASSAAWDSAATARQNSHAYAQGDIIAVSSNTGRVFMCITAGTSAGSLPGAYATAVDGDAVTDNSAVFRAGWRVTVSATATPQQVGFVQLIVKGALGAAGIFSSIYLDPAVTVT